MIDPIILSGIGSVIAGALTFYFSESIFKKEKVDFSSAKKYLLEGDIDTWNSFRDKYSNWIPHLEGHDLSGLNLSYANLAKANLNKAIFNEANLVGSTFESSQIRAASFENANLSGCNFSNSNLEGSNFSNANLGKANFNNANLDKVELNISKRLESSEINLQSSELTMEFIDNLSPREFETLIRNLLSQLGYDTQLTSETKDGGYDIIISGKSLIGDIIHAVEVKKYKKENRIRKPTAQMLLGIVESNRFNSGVLITNSYLTKDAYDFVKSNNRISVIDRDRLFELIKSVPNIRYDRITPSS